MAASYTTSRETVLKILGMLILCAAAGAQTQPAWRTFTKDLAPILQARCQSCHRPGEVAPMSLLTYKETRPWAKAIKDAILTKKMPPWFANSGHFKNERRLTGTEVATIAGWVENGAPEGDEKDKPAPIQFAEGWSIGKP